MALAAALRCQLRLRHAFVVIVADAAATMLISLLIRRFFGARIRIQRISRYDADIVSCYAAPCHACCHAAIAADAAAMP